MTIANYGDLKDKIRAWLDRGTDLDDVIPDFVSLAISTLNKVMRDTQMIAQTTVSLAQGDRFGPIPADMLDPVYVTSSGNPAAGLEERTINDIVGLRMRRMAAAGTPRYFAVVGRRLEVCPIPAGPVTLDLAYYRSIPALVADEDTNWLLTYQPDVLLYTALLHASTFLKDDAKTALFGTLVTQQVQAAIQQQSTVSPGQVA